MAMANPLAHDTHDLIGFRLQNRIPAGVGRLQTARVRDGRAVAHCLPLKLCVPIVLDETAKGWKFFGRYSDLIIARTERLHDQR